jgi:hypothetical protein
MGDTALIVAVEFVAEVRQVKTMADHTVNVTLNLPEYCVSQAAWFMQHQGDMVKSVSTLESLTILNGDDGHTATEEETKRGSAKLDSRRLRDRRDQRAGSEVQAAV